MDKRLSRRRVLELAALLAPWNATAQQTARTGKARIGVLWLGEVHAPDSRKSFFDNSLRLHEGVAGRDVVIESRFARAVEQLPREVFALLSMKVDVIVAIGSPVAFAVSSLTNSIPIVFVVYGDPVELGLVDSLSHPGGNLTGIYLPTAEHAGKRLELLLNVAPQSSRIGVLSYYSQVHLESRRTMAAAQRLGVQLVNVDLNSLIDLESAFHTFEKSGATALSILSDWQSGANLGPLADLSLSHKMPSISGYAHFARLGGLMAYGADPFEGLSRAAYLVSKVLSGAQPADLPVEQSTRYVLSLNKRTAKELGVSFPKSILQYADEVFS